MSGTEEGLGTPAEICHSVCRQSAVPGNPCLQGPLSSSLSSGLCLPCTLSWVMHLSGSPPSSPLSLASSPPVLGSPGPFSGLVYKNVTVPVYTALKGVRSSCLRSGCPHLKRPGSSRQWLEWGSMVRPRHTWLWAGSSVPHMLFYFVYGIF